MEERRRPPDRRARDEKEDGEGNFYLMVSDDSGSASHNEIVR